MAKKFYTPNVKVVHNGNSLCFTGTQENAQEALDWLFNIGAVNKLEHPEDWGTAYTFNARKGEVIEKLASHWLSTVCIPHFAKVGTIQSSHSRKALVEKAMKRAKRLANAWLRSCQLHERVMRYKGVILSPHSVGARESVTTEHETLAFLAAKEVSLNGELPLEKLAQP